MATKRSRPKPKSSKQVPVLVPKTIDPDVRKMMDFLSSFYSRGQLQIVLQDLLAKLPHTMHAAERLLRLRALRELGYKDYNKRNKADSDGEDDDTD